jgi:phosphate transport system substrate-binding protein
MIDVRTRLPVGVLVVVTLAACSREPAGTGTGAPAGGVVVRVTGSDTMVNLVQAWAENYKKARPDVSVQVAGGGTGVGMAGLIDGILDIASASREIEPDERDRATKRNGVAPKEFRVALDALAVYIHRNNPLEAVSIEELAEIYGDGGRTANWSQLGVKNAGCSGDEIIRVSRQNNSGTYAYFREAVLGTAREFKIGSIDQSGSKDVVTLVSRTPCAIGYSGMAYATPEVRTLKLSRKKGETAIAPTADAAMDGSYPLARPLYLYTREDPKGPVKDFIDWVLAQDGQAIVRDIGFVPAAGGTR